MAPPISVPVMLILPPIELGAYLTRSPRPDAAFTQCPQRNNVPSLQGGNGISLVQSHS
jgi:hypothetical protein